MVILQKLNSITEKLVSGPKWRLGINIKKGNITWLKLFLICSQCRGRGFKSSLNLLYYFHFSLFDNWRKDRIFWEKERIWWRRSISHNCSYTFSNRQCLTTLFVNSPDNVVISGRRVLSATEIWRYVFCAMQNMHFAILYAIWNLNMLFLNASLAHINLAFLTADKNATFH